MSETPYSQEAIFPTGQLDIGPGGIIVANSPNNRELLERVEQTIALSPIELYMLAVSYQEVASNSGLGNRLAFIGLSTIFQHSLVQQLLPTASQSLADTMLAIDSSSCPWYCAFLPNRAECHCGPSPSVDTVKLTPYSGLELLVEVTQVEERKTYVILGVSPSILEVKTAV